MKKQRFTEEQIVRFLRDAETSTIATAAHQHGVSEQSICRWKRQSGQTEVADVRELRQLRQENARPKNVLTERDWQVEVMKVVSPYFADRNCQFYWGFLIWNEIKTHRMLHHFLICGRTG